MANWRRFLELSTSHLVSPCRTIAGAWNSEDERVPLRRSWCSWTTFTRLEADAGYWTGELPLITELADTGIRDGGSWGQPFPYAELAHVMIPRRFEEEYADNGAFHIWGHEQDIDGLSMLLTADGIEHRHSKYVLEIRLF